METKKVIIEKPMSVDRFVILPIIEQYTSCYYGKGGFYLFGARQPVAIILISPSGRKVFRVNGNKILEISLEQLIREIPETIKTVEYLQTPSATLE